jgi:hypothetical protein
LGHGDGTFHLLSQIPVPGRPRGISMSDLNGDGNQDVITANGTTHTVWVLLGDGTGAFPVRSSYDVGYDAMSVTAGDLTLDGTLDLAVANLGMTSVSVLPGVGDGTFKPRMDFGASGNPTCVVIGDVDGDHLPDIVASNGDPGTISILRNMGGAGHPPITSVGLSERQAIDAPRISPNPLNPSGVLTFRTTRPGPVDLRVFDVRGRLARAIEVPLVPSGNHQLEIDGRDRWSNPLASGVYFYSLRTPDGDSRGRFAVLK